METVITKEDYNTSDMIFEEIKTQKVSNSMFKDKRINSYTRNSQERKLNCFLQKMYFHIEYQKTKIQIQNR